MSYWRHLFLLAVCALLAACGMLRPDLGDPPSPPVFSSAETAQLVVYRPRQTVHRKTDIYPDVLLDGTSLGSLRYNGYLVYPTAPADAELLISGKGGRANEWIFPERRLPIQLEAGKTLYVRLIVRYESGGLTRPGDYSLEVRPVREGTALVEMEGSRYLR